MIAFRSSVAVPPPFALAVIGTLVLAGCAVTSSQEPITLVEGWSDLRPGIFSNVLGPSTEYHYVPEVAPRSGWTVSNHTSTASQRAWRVVSHHGQTAMEQVFDNASGHWNPMIVAGDPLWREYELQTEVEVRTQRRVGIAFHYLDDRVYAFAGAENNELVVKTVSHEQAFHQPKEVVLARVPWVPTASPLSIRLKVSGTSANVILAGHVFRVQTPGYSQGKIAIVASGPAIFLKTTVLALPQEFAALRARVAQREQRESALEQQNPRLQLWKKVNTTGFGVRRNLRLGDLDGDGHKDLLIGQVRHHGPSDSHAELSCLTALTTEGKLLWRIGEPDPYNTHLTNDVAFQIHDLDGDGKNEVIYTMNQELVVAEGATGTTLRTQPTPLAVSSDARPPKFPRILGDAMLVADLRGAGRASDIILKDRYQHVWTFDAQLHPIWMGKCSTGHYPFAIDVDEDGKDEVLSGYCLFGHDGTLRWSWEPRLKDHADGAAIVRLGGENTPPRVVMVASDEGLVIGSLEGKIEVQHRIGHAQSASIANFRDDLPGLEIAVSDFWGNQGIVLLFDAKGRPIMEFEPMQAGSPLPPVNWSGRSEELFMVSADVREGGLFNGHGERAVRMPADGHPDLTFMVDDLTGDERDEIIVWDPYELWIYTQDRTASAPVVRRRRNDDSNESNYKIRVSEPVSGP